MADQEFEITTKLGIRAAQAKDAENLQLYCFADSSLEEVTNQLKDDLKDKKNVYRVVAEASGHAIGNVRVKRSQLDDEVGEISQLAVSPPFRAFGVADKLIEATEQIAQENGINLLQIEISQSEAPIIEAYKKWGFAERPVVTLEKLLNTSNPEESEETPSEPPAEEQPEASTDEPAQQELL